MMRYRDDNLDEVLQVLDERSRDTAERLERLADHEWARVGIGSEGGQRTVLVLARRLAHEGCHHLLDVERQSVATDKPPET